ncbi:hypothetical protein [Streptomyces tendae]|uniref:hypothetical protein n=1 Tax=Streptomyces tendae TaxID=1932 RepID=UPI0036BF3891
MPPSPEMLTYSFTLPAGPTSPRVARVATRAVLQGHGLEDMTDAACDARMRAALRVLGCVVRACEAEWGFGEAREPRGGTRMWAVVPRDGAGRYVGRRA